MSNRDRLAAAKEHVLARLKEIRPWVFNRSKGLPAELLKQEYSLCRSIDGLPPLKKLSAARQKRLSDEAARGDVKASCVLLDAAIDDLDDRITLRPSMLKQHAIMALQRSRIAMSSKRGRKSVTNFTRDWLIANWVKELQRFGFKPTRNREERKRESGCSVIAAVLSESGLNLSEEAVSKIWRRRSKT